ncbi:hypothetical protein A616_17140 [Brevibacillus brevis X23]|nr:hypothetical protein A616_17140 [Brevibacillus brevis X23]
MNTGDKVMFLEDIRIPVGDKGYFPVAMGDLGIIENVLDDKLTIKLLTKDGTVIAPKEIKLYQFQ